MASSETNGTPTTTAGTTHTLKHHSYQITPGNGFIIASIFEQLGPRETRRVGTFMADLAPVTDQGEFPKAVEAATALARLGAEAICDALDGTYKPSRGAN